MYILLAEKLVEIQRENNLFCISILPLPLCHSFIPFMNLISFTHFSVKTEVHLDLCPSDGTV
jgi:hypothetical protein